MSDDRTLVARALEGDSTAFDELATRHLERTFHIALRLVGNREDAEDAVQEAFGQAFRHLSRFERRSSFATWVTRITIRVCIDLERRRRRRPPPVTLESVPLDAMSRDLPTDEKAQHRETWARVERALLDLPPRLRTALVLRVIEGFEYADVAKAMGATIRSVRVYVFEARKRIARILEEGGVS